MNQQTRLDLLNKGLDLNDIQRNQRRLQRYFDRDDQRRFETVSALSCGQYSITWKLRFRETPDSNYRYIVLKTDRKYTDIEDNDDEEDDDEMDLDDDEEDEDDLSESQTPNEKDKLRALRWAKHVVSGVEVSNDPLNREFSGILSHQMDIDSWVYVEYLENGTISKFIEKAKQKRIAIPNRILWRFFMCLIRMVIAMGWPPAKPAGEDPKPVLEQIRGAPYGGLMHRDMHEENIMLGNMDPSDPNPEHMLTPMLHLIDLGAMQKLENTPMLNVAAVLNNIFDIGLVMISLITRNEELGQGIVPDEENARPIQIRPVGPPILTNAIPLLPDENRVTPFPWLDPDLRTTVCACLAARPEQRPSPAALYNAVRNAIMTRDQQYYAARYRNDGASESDQRIRLIIQELVLNA